MKCGAWEDYAVELNLFLQVKLFQTVPRYGDYFCTSNRFEFYFNREREFTMNQYLVLNSTHVTDMTAACKKLTAYPLKEVTRDITTQDLEPCFNKVNSKTISRNFMIKKFRLTLSVVSMTLVTIVSSKSI